MWQFIIYSVPFIYRSVLIVLPYCLDYYSFIVILEIMKCESSNFVLSFQGYLGYLGSYESPSEFQNVNFYVYQKKKILQCWHPNSIIVQSVNMGRLSVNACSLQFLSVPFCSFPVQIFYLLFKLSPNYFILFMLSIVKVTVFLMFFLNCSLVVCGNAVAFCVLIWYPAIF